MSLPSSGSRNNLSRKPRRKNLSLLYIVHGTDSSISINHKKKTKKKKGKGDLHIWYS
jgi:hypothetical protein